MGGSTLVKPEAVHEHANTANDGSFESMELRVYGVTLVRYIYIYIYIYNMDLKKSLIIENLYNSNREV